MRSATYILLCLLFLFSACGKKTDSTHHDDSTDDDPNEALYNEVEDIHMEAMAQGDDLIRLRTQILDKIAKSPTMEPEKKKKFGETVSALDSASNAMMGWMHQWMRNPPDSADVEKRREYFETQMQQIRLIRDVTGETIERAREVAAGE